MSTPVLQLPLDLSGVAITNKVVAELHIVAATGTRAIVTTRGPFYTRGLIVRNKTTGIELVPDVDYRPVHMFLEASLRAGQEICSVIIILPTSTVTEVEIDYQAIGGEYSASVSAIEQMLESLDLDNRTVFWGDLLGAPEYFPPTAHLHDVGDVYGFEYIVAVLEQIRRAILLGDQAAFDELRNYVNLQDNSLRGLITSLESLMEDHIGNTNNPHNTTKVHVGLGSVQNYGIASLADAQVGTSNTLYMTPLRVRDAITALVGNSISSHIANTNNPHATTKAHVGLGSVVNYGVATTVQAQAGAGTAYMTATLTGEAIAALALTPLNAHIGRQDNPHNTTKGHVGLASVDNFATASLVQATAGTASNLFLTPAGARSLIDSVVGNALTTHINRADNPHSTTKVHVGLGNVDNFATANTAQAEAGTASNLFMTPAGTRAMVLAINAAGGSADLSAHIANTNNPHGTTKVHVGLGSVLNYGMADQASAEAGSSNLLYMSPLRTKQAITAQAINPLTALINQRVVTGSNAQLNTLQIGTTGYFYHGGADVGLRVNGNRFFIFQASGNLVTQNGRVIAAGGFQPSDKRLKDKIVDADARPLWRLVNYKHFRMKETGENQSGVIAQQMQNVAPDRVFEYDHGIGRRKCKRLSVDYTGSAFEMAIAAGTEVDRLHEVVAVQQQEMDSQRDLIALLMGRLDTLEAKA